MTGSCAACLAQGVITGMNCNPALSVYHFVDRSF